METFALFDNGTATRIILGFLEPEEVPLRPLPINLDDRQVIHAAANGFYAAYQVLRDLGYVDGHKYCFSYQFADGAYALGESAGLAFGLRLAQEVYRQRVGAPLPYSIAATGRVSDATARAQVRRVGGIGPKLEAATAHLTRGDWVFYPAENEGEVGPALRAAAAERGIALIPVATVADAISSLLHADPAVGQGGEFPGPGPAPERDAEAAGPRGRRRSTAAPRVSQRAVLAVVVALLLVAVGAAAVWYGSQSPPSPPWAVPSSNGAKVHRLGVLALGSPVTSVPLMEAFRHKLRELGYVEGQNIRLEARWAEERAERLPDLAADLARLEVDVIVAIGSPAIAAARHAARTIPLVSLSVGDPMAQTGVDSMAPEVSRHLLEWLKQAAPGITRVTVLWHPEFPGAARWFQQAQDGAQALGIALQLLEVPTPDAFERSVAAARKGADALVIFPAALFATHERRLAALTVEHRMPAIAWRRSFAEAGGLMAYGPNLPVWGQHAATSVHQILQGVTPAGLPVEPPAPFKLVLNLDTAKVLGLTLPPWLLARADELIGGLELPDVHITPPPADLPPAVAAFSGIWEGRWGGVVVGRLVVESLDAESARVVHAWGDLPDGGERGWRRLSAQVLPGGRLQWASPSLKFTYTMAESRMSLDGVLAKLDQGVWHSWTVTMRKVGG